MPLWFTYVEIGRCQMFADVVVEALGARGDEVASNQRRERAGGGRVRRMRRGPEAVPGRRGRDAPVI